MAETIQAEPLLAVRPTRYRRHVNPVRILLHRYSTTASRRTVRQSLEALARLASGGRIPAERFPWHRLTYAQTARLREELADRFAPKGANLRITMLRAVLRECWRLGLMAAEDYQRAADLARVRGRSLLRGRSLEAGEIAALFAACRSDRRPVGRRDAAMFALLYGGGLRRAELVALDRHDYERGLGRLVVPGKGQAERAIPILANVREALELWLELRGDDVGPLFVRVNGLGEILAGRLSPQAVRHVCTRRGRQAELRPFAPHDLRRSAVSDLLDAGLDLPAVQRFVGHANPNTTAPYDRRGERVTRRAAGMLHVPL